MNTNKWANLTSYLTMSVRNLHRTNANNRISRTISNGGLQIPNINMRIMERRITTTVNRHTNTTKQLSIVTTNTRFSHQSNTTKTRGQRPSTTTTRRLHIDLNRRTINSTRIRHARIRPHNTANAVSLAATSRHRTKNSLTNSHNNHSNTKNRHRTRR